MSSPGALRRYAPGVDANLDAGAGPRCNIGPAEVRRRRSIAVTLTIATVVVAVGLLALGGPQAARLALWPFAAGAGVSWLQVTHHFCVRYGLGGLENLGRMGEQRRVATRLVEADRRRALKLIGEGALAGLLGTLVFLVLPL